MSSRSPGLSEEARPRSFSREMRGEGHWRDVVVEEADGESGEGAVWMWEDGVGVEEAGEEPAATVEGHVGGSEAVGRDLRSLYTECGAASMQYELAMRVCPLPWAVTVWKTR